MLSKDLTWCAAKHELAVLSKNLLDFGDLHLRLLQAIASTVLLDFSARAQDVAVQRAARVPEMAPSNPLQHMGLRPPMLLLPFPLQVLVRMHGLFAFDFKHHFCLISESWKLILLLPFPL